MLELMSRYWWVIALRGIVSIFFGIGAFLWPGITLFVLVIFFGAYMLVDGFFALVQATRLRHARMQWPAFALEGALGLIAGAITLAWPGITAIAWLYIMSAWTIMTGFLEIVAAMRLRTVLAGEIFLGLTGIISIVVGLFLAAMPTAGLIAWIWVIGSYSIIFGILLIGLAFRMRGSGAGTTASRFPHTAQSAH